MQKAEQSLEQFAQSVTTALTDWSRADRPVPEPLKQLQAVRQSVAERDEREESIWRMACNKILLDGIERLAELNDLGAEILRLRYADDLQVNEIVPKLSLNRHQIRRREQRATLDLAQLLLEQENVLQRRQAERLLQALSKPPTYDHLFGADDVVTQLTEELLADNRSWLIAVTGMGGQGKTAVTDQTIRQTINHLHFEETLVEYLTSGDIPLDNLLRLLANKLGLPASMNPAAVTQELSRLFKARPWLIWIDGLEADISHLADGLNKLANPSKFILTSRHRPSGGPFFVKPLPALSATAAAQLLRDHARRTGRLPMADAPEEQIAAIYDKVGGNPLALKLVVGLSDQHSIPTILNDLTELKIESKIEEMYKYIYWKAWRSLNGNAQTALKAMIMTTPSTPGDLQYIASMCGEISGDLRAVSAALDDLIQRSLVEPHGSPWDAEKLYGIHSLTRTFLHTEIIDYPTDSL